MLDIFLIGVLKNVILTQFHWHFTRISKILISEYVEIRDYTFKKSVIFEKAFDQVVVYFLSKLERVY